MGGAFDELLKQIGNQKLPPIDLWHPKEESSFDIRVRTDGTWLHEGVMIQRKAIAKIFSTILMREGKHYFLVTPHQKLRIQVDDVPFLAVDFEASGNGIEQRILFKTNMDDVVPLDGEHILIIKETACGPRPYIHVRRGLYARVLNEPFYRLADLVENPDEDPLLLWSAGTAFRVS